MVHKKASISVAVVPALLATFLVFTYQNCSLSTSSSKENSDTSIVDESLSSPENRHAINEPFYIPDTRLTWKPGAEVNKDWDIVEHRSSAEVDRQGLILKISKYQNPNTILKSARLGFDLNGGGYIQTLFLTACDGVSNGENVSIPDFGKGWQGSIRDDLHGGRYNPTQAGFRDRDGARVTGGIKNGKMVINQFAMPLYGDPVFDFVENETENIRFGTIENKTDDDGIDESTVSFNEELRSEFDFSSSVENVTSTFKILAFKRLEYNLYARLPSAIKQFTSTTATFSGGPQLGKKIFNSELLKSANRKRMSGRPLESTDLVGITYTTMGVRLPVKFKYLHYQTESSSDDEGGNPGVVTTATMVQFLDDKFKEGGIDFVCDSVLAKGSFSECKLKWSLVMLSTSESQTEGTAIALYTPDHSEINENQTGILNLYPKNNTNPFTLENRRLKAYFFVDYLDQTDPTTYVKKQFFAIRKRVKISELLSPATNRNYEINQVEFLRQEQYFLIGTPKEIYSAVEAYEISMINNK